MGDIIERNSVKKLKVYDKPNATSSGNISIHFHAPVTMYYGDYNLNGAYNSNSSQQYSEINSIYNSLGIRIRSRDLLKLNLIEVSSDLKITKFYNENFEYLNYLSINDASNLTELNTSNLKKLTVIWTEGIGNIPIDLSLNKEIISATFIYTTQVTAQTVDKLYKDLDTNGKLNGEINLNREGTSAGMVYKNSLISKGWTIDNNYI